MSVHSLVATSRFQITMLCAGLIAHLPGREGAEWSCDRRDLGRKHTHFSPSGG